MISPRHRPSSRSGFTLMELMVVLVLIGIMTAMILPELTGTFEAGLLHATGRKFADVLGVAYSRTVTVHQTHRLRLDKTAHRYVIEQRVPPSRGPSQFVPVRDLPGSEGTFDGRISVEVNPVGESLTGTAGRNPVAAAAGNSSVSDGEDTITFYPDGTAEAREIRLEDREGFRLALRINPTTARVQILEREHK